MVIKLENKIIYLDQREFFKLAWIPSLLVGFRFAIAPLLLIDALNHRTNILFVMGYIFAVLSDIFDGIIARRLGVSTAQLRQADSYADITLYLCIAVSTWLVYPEILVTLKIPLLVATTAQITLFTLSLIKFKKMPSFHTYTAKIWGLTLLIATISLFGFGYGETLWLAIIMCFVNTFEEIIMTFILPTWQCDILSVFHALELRKTLIAAKS